MPICGECGKFFSSSESLVEHETEGHDGGRVDEFRSGWAFRRSGVARAYWGGYSKGATGKTGFSGDEALAFREGFDDGKAGRPSQLKKAMPVEDLGHGFEVVMDSAACGGADDGELCEELEEGADGGDD
jgi:hypothetical protein